MRATTVLVLLCVMCPRINSQSDDVECFTADGSVGRCIESSKCMTSFLQANTVLCRYSRGYGTRLCCPMSAIRNYASYTAIGDREDFYQNDGPIAFPGEAEYGGFKPFNQHTTNNYNNYNPSLIENSDYRPHNLNPSFNKPQYHEKPNYFSQPTQHSRPQQTSSSSSYGEKPNYSSGSGGYQERPSYSSGGSGYDERPTISGSGYNERPSYSSSSNGFKERPNYSSSSTGFNTNPSYSSSSNGFQQPNYSGGFQGSSGSSRRPESNIYSKETTTSWEFPTSGRKTTPRPSWAIEHSDSGSSSNSRKRISEQKCEEYSQPVSQTINALPLSINTEAVPLRVQNCDFSAVKLIVGGEASELGEFPHQAAVGYKGRTSRNILWNCGGTLISERFVLTAAHCVNTSFGDPVVVRLGEYNIERDNDGADPEDFGVQRVIVHPNYLKAFKYNDIALLRLNRDVRFNKFIRPACLPTDNNIRGRPIATGWGRTDFVGRQSEILMKVALNVIDNRQCNTYYNSNGPAAASFASGIVDTMLCAGYVEGGRDTCLGDSGGPLTTTKKENPCIHYVVGITSFGKICAAPKSPGVYTRVIKYLNWIEKTIWS